MSKAMRAKSPTGSSKRYGAHATQPQFVYQHAWKLGDLVMWDNRSTMHRRDPFDGTARRIMHRTQIKGSHRPAAFGTAFAA
jgi:taurine dioxygenase